jgi:Plasmid pRiA4b ORF-3-like protein
MPDSLSPSDPAVYALRVVLRGISPLIWRRLLVRSDSTIADLHATLQVAFGWSGEHLHRFVIHGREHGTDSSADPRRVHLYDLGLRVRERFLYEYDFIDGWQHDVRLEHLLPLHSRHRYPVCIGGRRAAPPEDCGGPWAFLELRQHYSIVTIADRMLALLSPLIADSPDDDGDNPVGDGDDEPDDHDDHDQAEELVTLLHWLRIDRFDRRAANRHLAQLETTLVRAVA